MAKYCCGLNTLTIKLPYCNSCFKREVRSLLQDKFGRPHIPTCGRCCQWKMDASRESLVKYAVPENFPQISDDNSPEGSIHITVDDRFVVPFKMHFK